MTKLTLPHVTIETIQAIGQRALADRDSLFMDMAISQPELYRFAYEMHNLEDTNKSTMLGVLVAVYAALELETQKAKNSRKRLRHNDKSS
jgi:hypothetical protein